MSSFIPPIRCQHCGNTNITSIYLAYIDMKKTNNIEILYSSDIINKDIIEPSNQKKILNDLYKNLNLRDINICCSNTILTLPS